MALGRGSQWAEVGAASSRVLTSAVDSGFEIGAAIASKTAPFIVEGVVGLFPSGLPADLEGACSGFGPAMGCCEWAGRLGCE